MELPGLADRPSGIPIASSAYNVADNLTIDSELQPEFALTDVPLGELLPHRSRLFIGQDRQGVAFAILVD